MTDNLLMRWIIIVLIVAAAIASIAMNWGEDGPLNLGIDLRGGYSITYSISEKSLEEVIKAGEDPKEAAKAWLKEHPDTWHAWLEGVTTRDGGDAIAAVEAALGM